MNSAPPSLPGLGSLYWRDCTFKYAVHACVAGLLLAVGIQWASQPVAPADPPLPPSFEAEVADKVSVVGLVVAALSGLVLVRRYLWVRKILSHGSTVIGTVEKVDVHSWTTDSKDDIPNPTRTRRQAYYVTLRYTMHGEDRKVRLKLPNSPVVYSLHKGAETDLLVLDTASKKPLIRIVYLGPL